MRNRQSDLRGSLKDALGQDWLQYSRRQYCLQLDSCGSLSCSTLPLMKCSTDFMHC